MTSTLMPTFTCLVCFLQLRCAPFKLTLAYCISLSCMPVLHLTINHNTNSATNLCYSSVMFVTPLSCTFQPHYSHVSFLCLVCLSCTLQALLTPMLLVLFVFCLSCISSRMCSHISHLSLACSPTHLTPFSCMLVLNRTNINLNVCLSCLFTSNLTST